MNWMATVKAPMTVKWIESGIQGRSDLVEIRPTLEKYGLFIEGIYYLFLRSKPPTRGHWDVQVSEKFGTWLSSRDLQVSDDEAAAWILERAAAFWFASRPKYEQKMWVRHYSVILGEPLKLEFDEDLKEKLDWLRTKYFA